MFLNYHNLVQQSYSMASLCTSIRHLKCQTQYMNGMAMIHFVLENFEYSKFINLFKLNELYR